MKKNVGGSDRAIRLLIAFLLTALFVTNVVTGTLGIILLVAGVILFITSLVGFCPIYGILGISSCPMKKA